MIRLIKTIRVRTINSESEENVPLHSGTVNTTESRNENGNFVTSEIQARLKWSASRYSLYKPLVMTVTFENGETITLGTDELPLRLTVKETDVLSISGSIARPL